MFPRSSPFRLLTLAIFFVCLTLTAVATYLTHRSMVAETQARFDRATNSLAQNFRNRMSMYIYTLTHMRTLFDLDSRLTEKDFERAVTNLRLEEQVPGVHTIGWVERIPREELGRRTRELRKQRADFTVTPEGARDNYYPVTYVKRFYPGVTPYGYDLAMSPERNLAMEEARDTGQPTASEKVRPIAKTTDDFVFIVFSPHYRPGAPISTIEERRRALDGFLYAGFYATTYFGQIVEELNRINPYFALEIYDGGGAKAEQLMYASNVRTDTDPTLTRQIQVIAANHSWTFVVKALPSFTLPSVQRFPLLIFVFGFLASLGITIFIHRADRHSRRLAEEMQIVELTAKIGTTLKAEQDLENIVQLVTDTATKVTGAKFGAFFYNVLGADGEVLTLYTLSGAPKEAFEKFPHPRATPVFKPTFDGTAIVRSDDITKDPRYGKMAPHHGMPKGHLPVRSYLAAPVVSKSGKVMGGLFLGHSEPGVFTDSSENALKSIAIQAAVAMDNANLYKELREARADADLASQAKSMFLANMSHEIRTPLGIIIGFAELAREHVRDNVTETERNLDGIIRNGRELSRIIGEVLDLSKIEAKALQVEETTFSLAKLLDDLQATWSHQASAKGVRLEIVTGDSFPARVKSDPTRLRQILMNLTSNAVKFTAKGTVKISARQLSDGEAPILEFTVEDTGTGISKENQGRLFHAFSQADGSITRKFGGTGLGLVISRELARALHGDLVLDWSEPGQGSRFRFTVPVKKAEVATGSSDAPTVSLAGLRVLLVEDSPDNQFLVSMYLEKAGAKVEIADNGERGVELATSQDYDVVLMDIQMPVLDGYGALERLKRAGYRKPVVALTAHAMKEERERALALGFADYLTKPLDRASLLKTMGTYVAAETPRPPPPNRPS